MTMGLLEGFAGGWLATFSIIHECRNETGSYTIDQAPNQRKEEMKISSGAGKEGNICRRIWLFALPSGVRPRGFPLRNLVRGLSLLPDWLPSLRFAYSRASAKT